MNLRFLFLDYLKFIVNALKFVQKAAHEDSFVVVIAGENYTMGLCLNFVTLLMINMETPEDFYKRKFEWMPDTILNEIGYFNLFRLELFVSQQAYRIKGVIREFSTA